jgi:hypothetical protein
MEQYEKVLLPNIAALTQRRRFDDALLLQHKLDEIRKNWPRPEEEPAPVVRAPSGPRVVDVLALIDVKRDVRIGTWRLTAEGLSLDATPDQFGACEIPYEPPAEYDFEVAFKPLKPGSNVNVYLTADGHSFAWKLNGHGRTPPLYGFELIDGKKAFDVPGASVTKDFALKVGERTTTVVEVRRGGLRALVDGKEFLHLSCDFSRFSMEDKTRLSNDRHLGLGSYSRAVLFEKALVRELPEPAK